MCSGRSSNHYTGKRKHPPHQMDTYYAFSEMSSIRTSQGNARYKQRNLVLIDPNEQLVRRVSLCSAITFLSIIIWWSAWIPLTLGIVAITAYLTGYRVVIADYSERKSKRKNDEYEAISHDII
jgi:hypothetical protein